MINIRRNIAHNNHKKYYIYRFSKGESWYLPTCNTSCSKCLSVYLDNHYLKIIRELKEAGLLPKNYPLVCCACFD